MVNGVSLVIYILAIVDRSTYLVCEDDRVPVTVCEFVSICQQYVDIVSVETIMGDVLQYTRWQHQVFYLRTQ